MKTADPRRHYPGLEHDVRWRELVFPPDYRNPDPKRRYHLVVIGAGTAGLVVAIAAAGLGANVALVERSAMGGDCLNVGCVPSKALLEFTRRANRPADFDAAFAWLRRIRAQISAHDSVERYTRAGVHVFLGDARLLDERTVQVGSRRLSARRIVLTTGARAVLPPIPGLLECEPLTNETLFDLTERPRSLAILGGGPLGCEMAQAFSAFGIDVRLFETADRLLPTETPQAGEIIAGALEALGVTLHLGSPVSAVRRLATGVAVMAGQSEAQVERVLVAAGRRANIEDLNLELLGVEIDEAKLVKVDKHLRTTNPRIFAAGDVCSRLQFTHNADAHARIVVQNALFAPTATTGKLIVPHCTYTAPEVAQVGALASELETLGTPFDRYRVALDELDRSKTQGDEEGFAEVLTASGRDRILGATIVGHDAGEQIAGVCIAMSNGLGLKALGKVVLPYPTRSEYLRRLADDYNRTRLTPMAKRLMQTWFDWNA